MSATVTFGDQLVDANTRFKKLQSVKPSRSTGVVRAIAISDDGTLLATGDDGGGLEVRLYDTASHRWCLVRKYTRGGQIRTLQWHKAAPSAPSALFLGSSYGLIWRINIHILQDDIFSKRLDTIDRAKADGYVHCLAVTPGGKLIVASGETITLYDRPFETKDNLGPALVFQRVEPTASNEERAQFEAQYDVRWVPRVRKFHFLQGDLILLSFFGYVGIQVYSMTNGMHQFTIPLRHGCIVGSTAMSPAGDILAVSNLRDGVDWYSVTSMQYLMTSKFDVASPTSRNVIVDLTFIDSLSVGVGHSSGDFVIASLGFPRATRHEVRKTSEGGRTFTEAAPNIAFGISGNTPLLVRAVIDRSGRWSILELRQVIASKDRSRRLASQATTRRGQDESGYSQLTSDIQEQAIVRWILANVKNHPRGAIPTLIMSLWGIGRLLSYIGASVFFFLPFNKSSSTSRLPVTVTATETTYSTATMISMAQVTQTATSTYISTNWQTVTVTPPPTSSACFCTVMLSGVLQQAAVETGIAAGDMPAYIDQSSLR